MWADEGPSPIINGAVTGMPLQLNPGAGAVVAFAVKSGPVVGTTVAFAATASGGVWETNNLNAMTMVDINQVNDTSLLPSPPTSSITGGPMGGGAGATFPYTYVVTYLETGGRKATQARPSRWRATRPA